MRENKVYRKPDFTMMCFAVNENVAASDCDYYNPTRVDCLISQYHMIFYTACESVTNGVNYTEMMKEGAIVTVDSDVSLDSAMDAINYLADLSDGTLDNTYRSGKYTLSAGQYLVWTSGQTHAGKISTSITSGINASK